MQIETPEKQEISSSKSSMQLQIGSICCAIKCQDTNMLARLRQHYLDFLTEGPVDVSVELSGVDQLKADELEEALSETRFIHGENNFRTTSNIISGTYDLARGTIKISGEKNLANPDLRINHLNRLLSLGYYTACKVRYNGNPPAFLVHSCGIIRHGRAMLFAGPSEAGKTTVGRLCGDCYGQVINDEIVLVSRLPGDDCRLSVEGVPMLGGLPRRIKAGAPLACIFLLKQSKRTAVRELDRTEAFLRFMRQVITPAYIGQKDKRAVYALIAEFSDVVTGLTPFFELEFTLDRQSLWRAVEDTEVMLEKRYKKYE
ncbi:MAG: hypothetical protein ABR958_03090 [Dehalococcoidales bacterium]